ncbi:hypothetical protein TraAM80_10560 [Trypanosoma rangeli]|uniref:Uncharacterized protein n=1 Tax=Trypanosoma rangeli TaxID=5698 RepID=A0A3R7MT68_TRYRA|nr:uncharacterized protein TraAM80_10560 [Trypanosoma rangeli]RNE94835.1 hypothetical protein TraAM80_10560 [Trypanosoma rangeli]|eukprot:RNE94835.1 hypothetical protein TraAM80_10560 [Trypanosoma rangeli]
MCAPLPGPCWAFLSTVVGHAASCDGRVPPHRVFDLLLELTRSYYLFIYCSEGPADKGDSNAPVPTCYGALVVVAADVLRHGPPHRCQALMHVQRDNGEERLMPSQDGAGVTPERARVPGERTPPPQERRGRGSRSLSASWCPSWTWMTQTSTALKKGSSVQRFWATLASAWRTTSSPVGKRLGCSKLSSHLPSSCTQSASLCSA